MVPEIIEDVTSLNSFDEVLGHLLVTYNWFADSIADARAMEDKSEEIPPIGGFCVKLRNRWGSQVEVGVGRKIWFLFQLEPETRKCLTDNPAMNGSLVFYLYGWHYTELERDSLISKESCLVALRQWFEEGRLPDGFATV